MNSVCVLSNEFLVTYYTFLGLYPPVKNHCIRGKEKDASQKGQYKRERERKKWKNTDVVFFFL